MGALALRDLPDWPAAMPRDMALAYTQVAEAQLRAWERAGRVHFRPRGPRGGALALRSELDTALADMFSESAEDMDFGD